MDDLRQQKLQKLLFFLRILRKRREKMLQMMSVLLSRRRKFYLDLKAVLALISDGKSSSVVRSCRRYQRNKGWWELVSNYNDSRFKKTFRISRKTFHFILEKIRHRFVQTSFLLLDWLLYTVVVKCNSFINININFIH